jgi:hypothetical protein
VWTRWAKTTSLPMWCWIEVSKSLQVIRRRDGWESWSPPYTSVVGNSDLRKSRTASTSKVRMRPSARSTTTRSPGSMSPSLRKTEGPSTLSTCPSMIEGPGWPGVGEFSNHAAVLRRGPGWGTARVPSGARPIGKTGVSTPMAGMLRCTGFDGPSGGPASWVGAGGRWWPPEPLPGVST